MIRVERHEEDFIFAIGHKRVRHRIPTSPEVIQALADQMSRERIRAIQSGEETWACGDWSMRAAGKETQHDRDMERKRIYLRVGERTWHLLGTEVLALGQSCRRALEA